MRLTVCAVGKFRSGPESVLIDDYARRIATSGRGIGYSAFEIKAVEAPRSISGQARQQRETDALLAAAPENSKHIVLDERGATLSSMRFSEQLALWRDDGINNTAFFIGGADGHTDLLRESADLMLSFGKATWPHALARIMLCEQIYRAITISSGHPYHRE